MNDILNILNSLSPEKRAALEKILRENGRKYNVFPASYSQQRLWFLDQFEPGSPYYNIPSVMRIKGKLSLSVFQKAIEEIARRHESLRTNFLSLEGKPVQVISQKVEIPFEVIDLAGLSEEAEKDPEVKRILSEKARCSFNLSGEALLRITVLRLDEEDHVVIIVMHHIISDGWSMGVLVREISELYNAFSIGMPSSLSEPEIQYADYTLWQKEFLEGELLERQLEYWKRKLGNSSQYLDLPFDRPRPAVYTNNGSSLTGTIPLKTLEGLRDLGRKDKATLFMTLLAAFQVLLHKYSAQEDINIGTPVANRPRKELEGVIGLFINTIVIRTGISDKESFHEYLQKVRTATLEAYENQDIPFEYLVEKLRPVREMSYQPMFQAMFILQNVPMDSQPFRGLEFSMLDVDTGTSTSEITLIASEGLDGLNVSVEYNTDLFDRSTIERMLRHYENLLNHILLNPEARISELQLMDEAEKNMVVYQWNNTKALPEVHSCIHELFERQAERNPDKVAAVFEGCSLTYRELNEKSNQLAHRLLKLGVGAEDIIGICIERSLEMLISMLGVLKAGAAYLPLDASYPLERLKFMMEDAGGKVLITQSHLRQILPDFDGPVVLMDKEQEEITPESNLNPAVSADADNLAYVIYTSGSTGRPKGSMISHASLINVYKSWENAYELTSRANCHLQMASFSFDVFTGDCTRALCSGGKLVIAPREMLLEGEKLYNLMKKEKVNTAEFVPAVLRNLIQYLDESGNKLDFLHLLIAGSDVWYAGEYKKFQKYCGSDTRLINSYGLTETTIDSSYFESTHLEMPNDRLVPIGRPFSNMTLYVLDVNLQPLALDLKGELYVGGMGLARGYLNRPDVTSEKFIPDPFSKNPGSRLYRSGDMARFLPDGNIEFLGRIDSQIKLRGLRVELGEIETAMSEFPDVKDAVVIAREDTPGDKKIVAYIVPLNGNGILIPELRHFLSGRLPEFMIPSAFIHLQELPVTPNGKVDRRALPCPDVNEMIKEIESNYAAPRSVVEGIVASIWSDILRIPKVGINDNFFELGGHSLLATQVTSRIKTAFKLEIPLRSIFEHPTIAGLSRIIENEELKRNGLMDKAISPVPRGNGLFPLSFAQERLWFLDQLEPGNSAYNVPEGLRIHAKINAEMLQESLNIIVRRHEILRTSFLSVDGKSYQKISTELNVTLPVIEAEELCAEEKEKLINETISTEAQKPFRLDTLPLFRTLLIRLSEEEFVLVLTFHHIITDAWSSRVMFSELINCYRHIANGEPVAATGLKIQYADYAAWQREYFSGESLRRHAEYWTRKLKGSPKLLELPTDRPRPAIQSHNGSAMSFMLPVELSDGVKKLNRDYGVTLFMSLLSIFQVLLYRYSRQNEILIGTPIANRNRDDIEELIGFFVNTLVIRVNISDKMRFSDLLRQTKETALEAYTYQDMPFEMIIDLLHLERSVSYSPLFQVMFMSESLQPESRIAGEGMDIRQIDIKTNATKYDITFSLAEETKGLGLTIEYNTDIFEKETIEKMFSHYRSILEHVLENPDSVVSAIPLLSHEEEMAVIEKLAFAHPSKYNLGEMIHKAFERTASLRKDSTAIVFRENKMSYGELNRRSNSLAHYLIKKGTAPETVVGIALRKSPELIISLLAVLKAGGCYLPLDANYPKERLDYIIEDSKLRILITEKELSSKFSSGLKDNILIDLERDEIEKHSSLNPEEQWPLPDNLAYIIYTSGSTGRPKGTMLTHSNLMHYISWCLGEYPLDEETGSVFHLSISFDAAVTSIYPTLLSGSPLRIVPDEENIYSLSNELAESKTIGTLKITPAHMDVLSEQLKNAEIDKNGDPSFSLKAFVVGGENLTGKQISFYQDKYPGTLIYNEYGPTEATVGCIVYEASNSRHEGSIPIGRVIPGVYAYILDENLNLVGENIPGELFIGGEGLSRGYLGKPELTAERFIPDPFSSLPGKRLYRTGDRVKLLKDGNMEFLGRLDHQVKLRGFRIEPGEIEHAILQIDKVKDAAVLYRERNGRNYLAAYLSFKEKQPEETHKVLSNEIREFLRGRLPDYMIPSSIFILNEMPLNTNGKIDRSALPEDVTGRGTEEEALPNTEAGEILLRVWKEVLGLDKISTGDNFFEIGGDSILALQVVARAREKGLKIQPMHLFQHQTLSQLALFASSAESGICNAYDNPEGKFELIPVQKSFFEQDLEQRNHWNQSIFFEITEKAELQPLEAAVKNVISHHDVLRAVFVKEDGRMLMQIGPASENVPFNIIDLSTVEEKDLKSKVELSVSEVQGSLDIEKGPVIRFAYFKLNENERDMLLIAAHHLVIDVVSWRILLEDILTSYNSIKEHRPLSLPSKTTSYKRWSGYLQEYSRSEEISREADYWLRLPYHKWAPLQRDNMNGGNLEKDSSEITVSLSSSDTLILSRDIQKVLNASIMEVLLTALTRAYSAWSGQSALLIDVEGHGREGTGENYDLSRTVGWFTSIYPLLLDLVPSTNPLESLRLIKEQVRSVPRHGMGYGILKYLSDDKQLREELNSLPRSEISFNYLGQLNNNLVQEINPQFSPAKYESKPDRGLLNSSAYLIDILCSIAGGNFSVQMRYSRNIFNECSIGRFPGLFLDELKLIIELSKNGQAALTGSDFPLANLSNEKLDKVLNRLNKKTLRA